MTVCCEPIGVVHSPIATPADAPRHCSISEVSGTIEVFEPFADGLLTIEERDRIVVLFHFHRSKGYDLVQHPPHHDRPRGVFSICSPRRPNPIGLSVLELTRVDGRFLHVRNLDMIDGTPVLDIKPFIPPR